MTPAPSDSLELFSQEKVHPDGSITFDLFTAPLTLTFGIAGPAVLTLTQSPAAGNRGLIDFAPGLAGRAASAGQMGYEAFNAGEFGIVGAGTVLGVRIVRVFDQLFVGSQAADTRGQINVQGGAAGVYYFDQNLSGNFYDVVGQGNRLRFGFNNANFFQFDGFATNYGAIEDIPGSGTGAHARLEMRPGSGIYTYNWFDDGVNNVFDTSTAADGSAGLITESPGRLRAVARVAGAPSLGDAWYTPNGGFSLDVVGNLHAGGFPVSSDARLKRDVRPLRGSLELLRRLEGVSFLWRDRPKLRPQQLNLRKHYGQHKDRALGFIAQDVERVIPELVTTNGLDDVRALDYDRFAPLLVEAVKELADRLETLEAR